MDHLSIDAEEMARRHDEDLIASLKMIGEGGPNFDRFDKDSFEEHDHEVEKVEERKLPDVYQ